MKKTTKILTITLSIVLCVALLGIGTFVYASETAKKNSIGLDAAIDAAMSDAGCAEENTIIQKARRTFEDGIFVYDIEFVSGGYEYDYLLKASDGTILEKDKDKEASLANTNTPADNTANTQTSEAPTEITIEEAKAIALKDAGVSEADVNITKTQKDFDDGISYYDIEFYTDSYEYEYEVSLNGKILAAEKDPFRIVGAGNNTGNSNNNSNGSSVSGNSGNTNSSDKNSSSGNSGSNITLEKAKEIALKDAGVSSGDATFTQAYKDYDDGRSYYDVEFRTDSYKYEYEISLKGTILSVDRDPRKSSNSGNSGNTGSNNSNNTNNSVSSGTSQQTPDETKYIGIDKAKSIALNHAGLSASDVKFTKAKLEKDDGRVMYEIEFRKDYFEYEYDIDAKTGKILSAEKDD